jgi:hypothetical protein
MKEKPIILREILPSTIDSDGVKVQPFCDDASLKKSLKLEQEQDCLNQILGIHGKVTQVLPNDRNRYSWDEGSWNREHDDLLQEELDESIRKRDAWLEDGNPSGDPEDDTAFRCVPEQ